MRGCGDGAVVWLFYAGKFIISHWPGKRGRMLPGSFREGMPKLPAIPLL
jgi:hypothetical protein